MKAYLIHCNLFSNRLKPATTALEACGFDIEIVSTWDADQIDSKLISSGSEERWDYAINFIAAILIANASIIALKDSTYAEVLQQSKELLNSNAKLPRWMDSRKLKPGEISVLLKHYYAISSIANSTNSHGLIAEDDIIRHDKSEYAMKDLEEELPNNNYDYIDLAGGAGLDAKANSVPMAGNLWHVNPARTRTNACYIISKKYAQSIVNKFFPLIFPIDLHLQYLFGLEQPNLCCWANDPIFIHGSELNIYKSWRF